VRGGEKSTRDGDKVHKYIGGKGGRETPFQCIHASVGFSVFVSYCSCHLYLLGDYWRCDFHTLYRFVCFLVAIYILNLIIFIKKAKEKKKKEEEKKTESISGRRCF
jgi:hypothetical protein